MFHISNKIESTNSGSNILNQIDYITAYFGNNNLHVGGAEKLSVCF